MATEGVPSVLPIPGIVREKLELAAKAGFAPTWQRAGVLFLEQALSENSDEITHRLHRLFVAPAKEAGGAPGRAEPHGVSPTSRKEEPEYIGRYKRQAENPGTLPWKIRQYLKANGQTTREKLQQVCVSQLGCKDRGSGSINASIKALAAAGYITVEGNRYSDAISSNE